MEAPASGRRSTRRQISPGAYTRLCIASFIGLVAIIPSGGLVRLTDSGLGCPDWPGCHGEIVPPNSSHAWIEYSNRVLSAIIVAVSVIAWLAVYRLPGASKRLRRAAMLPAVASVAQGPLGGLTVLFDLHPLFVASHFLLSIVALAAGVVLVLRARDHRRGVERVPNPRRAAASSGVLALLLGVVVTGVLVTAAGPHSGDPEVIDRLGTLSTAAAIHVRVVIGFVVAALAYAFWLYRSRVADPLTRRLIGVFIPLLAAQIAIGEYQYRNQLPWEVIAVHVTIAGLLWACGVAIAWLVAQPERSTAAQSVPGTDPSSAPAAAAARQALSTDRA